MIKQKNYINKELYFESYEFSFFRFFLILFEFNELCYLKLTKKEGLNRLLCLSRKVNMRRMGTMWRNSRE